MQEAGTAQMNAAAEADAAAFASRMETLDRQKASVAVEMAALVRCAACGHQGSRGCSTCQTLDQGL